MRVGSSMNIIQPGLCFQPQVCNHFLSGFIPHMYFISFSSGCSRENRTSSLLHASFFFLFFLQQHYQ